MTDRELMQQALDAMEFIPECGSMIGHVAEMKRVAAVAALRDRLAQQEQEPVAYIRVSKTGHVMACAKSKKFDELPDKTLLYTAPSQRQWVGLTDEDKAGFWKADQMTIEEWDTLFNEIEAKLREKNGAA